ncbi:MAG: PASTA domain-containing protein [Synergistaceae bacterium]|jgi:serine/threonine-protein kinase|nr:PASTA domain-containing protein [Synergistaceae bacterium]
MDKMLRWTVLFVVLVIFASGTVAVYTVFFKSAPDDILVPSFRDKPVTEAAEEAKRLGLSVKIEQVISSLPRGTVLTQNPEPGRRMLKDKTVIFQISRGGVRRAVPDVRNLDVARAQTVIREQGFDVGDILYIRDSSRTAGFVIAQSPAAPANVPADKKIDLLVNQGGANSDGKTVVPDVAQMTERQARDLLTASGFRIPAVDYVYSPNATEGRVIGTRPAAGAEARAGEGIRLKIATTKRPDGVPEPTPASTSASTSTPTPTEAPAATSPAGSAASSIVSVVESARNSATAQRPGGTAPAGGVAPTGNTAPAGGAAPAENARTQAPTVIQNPAISGGAPPANSTPAAGGTPAAASGASAATGGASGGASAGTVQPSLSPPLGGKVARIRYQVPPLARPLQLKIEIVDPSGTKVLLDRAAKSGEYVSIDAPYSRECAVTVYLGGEFVWQDRYM